ncbi:unnamed protein product [Cuscuta campestris]|uniref:Anaphase-promoting complex subunit 4 WD40 domain-containing protein n=1 Tax=Cuscuta campestris TaxID=132261 RepID=A0A484K9H7_9ASTE|nr:unnamed protein product [Cuscuta campestris]
MAETRRLRGHKAAATCCIASRSRPGLIATAAEDGNVCWFDMRCKDAIFTMDVANHNPISSICFKPGNEDIIYASSGNEVKCFEVNMGNSSKQLESYNYNKDEINQIDCTVNSSFLAAADDSGDVKIVDIRQQCLYKTLRSGHTSICSSVQFVPWRPWQVVTGGLDSKLVVWDYSKGRPQKIVDFGMPDASNEEKTVQCLNPAFAHALALPEVDMVDKVGKICLAARGDGVVDILNIDSDLNSSSKSKRSSNKPKDTSQGQNWRLDHTLGGHTAAVSCVAFSVFGGEKGKFIISGGNDKQVRVWDWTKLFTGDGTNTSSNDLLNLQLNLRRKVNWLCTAPTDSDNLVVCDTSKVVKVYTIA